MVARNSSSEQGLGFILNDISRLARKEFDRRVRPLRLTRAQWLVLVHLARQPGCTQSEIPDSLQLQKITIGRHAERLLRAGWIERRDDAKDARAYRLFVSRKAGPLLAKLTTVADELRREYLDGLTDTRCEALVSDLLHIKSNLLRM